MVQRNKLLVKDVYDPKKMSSLIVNENDSLNTIVRAFSEQSSCSGVFVVDKKGRYRGVITRADLLNWARFKLGVGIRSERFIS